MIDERKSTVNKDPEKIRAYSESKEVDFSGVEYIVIDWDGTLVESMGAYTESYTKTLNSQFGIDPETLKEFYQETMGAPLSWQMKEGAARFAGVKIEDTKDLENLFWENLTGLAPEIVPRAKEFLNQLGKRGFKVIIWSGTKIEILEEKINLLSFSSSVDFWIGNVPGDQNLVKGPGLFRLIAEKFGHTSQDLATKTLVVGDGEADMEAGRAIGAKTAGFTRFKTAAQLKKAGADFVFVDFPELLEKLKK